MRQHACFVRCAILCILLTGESRVLASGQTSGPENSTAEQKIEHIMSSVTARCHSRANGVDRIEFVPPTKSEFAEVKALGEQAVGPLSKYLDLQFKDGLTQLYAVKFLTVLHTSSTLSPLKKTFMEEQQWEVTRAAALSAIFSVSEVEAKPYVEAALKDKSQLVRERALHLSELHKSHNK